MYVFPALRYLTAAAAICVSLAWSDDAVCAVINASLFLLPFTLLLGLTGRFSISLSGASVAALFVYAVGEAKFFYLGDRLAVADYSFVIEPANWTLVSRYPLLSYAMAGFVLLALLLAVDARIYERRRMSQRGRVRATSLWVFGVLCACCVLERNHHAWEVWKDDADCAEFRCGVMARLVFSVAVFEFVPATPSGDPARFLARMRDLPPEPEPAVRQADIVVWLNESTFDPRQYALPGAHLPPLAMMDATADTRARSPLRVHTFGGKTWLSEFSLLTGMVPDDFGARRNLVFNTVAPRTTTNLVRVLKGQGYKTVVLMPTFKRLYGAGRTYLGMGFDEVLTLRDFPEYDALPGDEWDIAESPLLAEAAQHIVERHRTGPDGAAPILVYLLSIKEHAPYSKSVPVEFALDNSGIDQTLAAKLTDYVNKLRTLDASVNALSKGLLKPQQRPVVFAWFGDHQAYFEEAAPPYAYALSKPEHITQYQARTNFAATAIEGVPLTDIAFLPSLLLDHAGAKKDRYFSALWAMRRLCGGLMDECPDQALVASYKSYVFGPELALFAP